jgi:ABC-type transport system involved in multi-copper enzyme maturation permease subunit
MTMKLFVWIGGILFVVVAIVLAYAATLPNEFRVSRTASIKAPREKIFPLINDLKNFNQWNPFAKADPTANITYSGPPSGRGAADSWDSNGRAGKGSLEIIDTAPLSSVTMKLDIQKPYEGHNTIMFALQSNADATNVTWLMTGRYAFIAKVMGVIFNMDKMIGGEFEKGLADLKARAES